MGAIKRALYEFKATLRSKDVLFWVIGWPIIWMLMTAYIFIPSGTKPLSLSITIIDMDKGINIEEFNKIANYVNTSYANYTFKPINFTKELIKVIEDYCKSKDINLKLEVIRDVCNNSSTCINYGKKIIGERDIDVVIVVPRNASLCYTIWAPVRLIILLKAGQPTEEYIFMGSVIQPLVNMSIATSLKRIDLVVNFIPEEVQEHVNISVIKYSLYGLVFPLTLELESVKPKTIADRPGMLGWMTIGALGYVAVLASMTSAIGIFVYRRESGILRRLIASPIKLRDFILGDIVSTLMFEGLSMIILIVVGLALGARIILNPLNPLHLLAIIVIAIAALFAYGIGLLLAPIVRSPRGATGIGVVISMILIFTTGIWYPPKELLIEPLRTFSNIFPPSIAFDIVRDIIVWQRSLEYIAPKLMTMSLGCMVLLLAVMMMYYKRLERIVSKFL